ncbi:MAG TPA: SCO family protein [Candidatus Saccharimonadales bacterium]|nr:SCO family protein [Candidatus Saccharimonadales bacterium]
MQTLCRLYIASLCALLVLTARGQSPAPARQVFEVRGVVRALEPDGKTVVIQHEAIPHYMDAMTMPFEVHDSKELRGLQPGDAILFRMVVTPAEGWVEGITKQGKSPAELPSRSSIHISRALEPLDEGDLLPDYHFTNELGRAVSLSQYKGQVIAFTFFFTRCPFPNFCPRLTSNFSEAAAKLDHASNAPPQWHFFSISFDPTNDTPARLEAYGRHAHYDPRHWSFLTGDLGQISDLADQCGESFWTEGGSISHNLRTLVVDARGRIRKIYGGSNWTSDELVQDMIRH